jgi:hypothetical protein
MDDETPQDAPEPGEAEPEAGNPGGFRSLQRISGGAPEFPVTVRWG